ncbi:ATP-utilizing enzyme of ATP-grasp superfamily [Cenarchaeum symbiosum A]|uniref:5-formaminoimidazole-4-carboxamide-1-(beta)-D-ribofuranosyl 5'-monophosphate synthetase n=1 Tax=Cenarchaeum symbiosum (strain A) TaxID=414004 RepID=PURP_CENSY|nr:RecName: Full=5-formaminoimidazole-4-carboxamide-1-(beta)-D-ribofuranosyl 5'-monophosphate synthetase; AltName: Full=5-aminoimidazole-4-carboxamide-1-beta-D-ribofuranosyl 5'-monophosphate--formate ligase [Cenarchaeum symbiosum A]ABK76884.1 ATP-utilizing enzyme of ATP-grasp superfamily [Cenarchaeum symbiosum A]
MKSVSTLGSHCSLQLLKGAKDEGFRTLLVCERRRERFYRRFGFIDELVLVDGFGELLGDECQSVLAENDSILIPHGTLVAQMSPDQIESIGVPVFGNKWILRWESDRSLKERLMREARLRMPRSIDSPGDIDTLVIVKRQGAAGGKGYFMANSEEEYESKRLSLIESGVISTDEDLYIQEYVPGVLAYLQFFYSPLKADIEFFGADQRHESDIEGLARIPAPVQMGSSGIPSFNVIGNSPLVLRESLLEGAYRMGEDFVEASSRLVAPGMNGPFCIEGVYGDDGRFTSFEFSARIVAGTNIYMNGSPYYGLLFDEPISMGRRIAREIKSAIAEERLDETVT